MTVPNSAGSPAGSPQASPSERPSAGRGPAATPDGWRSVFAAGSPTAALEPILNSSSVRVQLEALDHLERVAIAQQGAFRRELTIANLCLMVAGVLSGLVLVLAPLLPEGNAGWWAWLPRIMGVATAQQRAFRRELTIANLCLMVAGVLSGLVLVLVPLMPSANAGWWAWLPRIMGAATLALGAIAALHTYKAREGNRLQRWLSARSGAEMARAGVFMTIAERAAGAGSELALAALELINRDLLENQRTWFRTRADQHRRSSDWTTSWGGLATALAFVGGSGAVIASFEPSQTWIAVAGVIGAAVGAYAVNRESLRLDTANANGYEKAAAALDAIALRYDTVEAEVKAGKPDALRAFTAAITEQLSAEHKRWLEGSTQAEAVLGKLDNQLQRLNAQGPSSPPAGGNGAADTEAQRAGG